MQTLQITGFHAVTQNLFWALAHSIYVPTTYLVVHAVHKIYAWQLKVLSWIKRNCDFLGETTIYKAKSFTTDSFSTGQTFIWFIGFAMTSRDFESFVAFLTMFFKIIWRSIPPKRCCDLIYMTKYLKKF